MAYVRKKKTKGGEYYQLVEGRRENGKVKQRVLAHLGKCKTVEKALRWWPGMILRRWHVARDLRENAEITLNIMRKTMADKDEPRQELMLRFLDESGSMRRRKLAPHELKDAYYRGEFDWEHRLPGDLYTTWQAEYWHKMDYVARLEREASELEERYVKLYAINGGAPEEGRRLLRDRFQRLLDAYERRSQRLEALLKEKRAHWLKSKGLEDADPARQLLYAFDGSQMAIEEAWANKEK